MKYILPLLILFMGCQNPVDLKKVALMGEAQGTYYSIIYYDTEARDFQIEIDSILDKFDESVSLWVPQSLLSRVNRNEDNIVLDKYFIDNFNISKDVSLKSEGAFDFTIGSLIKAWGFGFDNSKTIEEDQIDHLLSITGHQKVRIENAKIVKDNPDIHFDFNAVAQGYSVDLIGEFLSAQGIENYLIDIGGEIKGIGQKPDNTKWKVGIEKPAESKNDGRDLKAVAELFNNSIATSGNYRKFYEEDGVRYSHTINPKTGYPAKNRLLSVSVLHHSTAYADAYATAFMVMGYTKARLFTENNEEIEALFIYSTTDGNYESYASPGFKNIITEEFE